MLLGPDGSREEGAGVDGLLHIPQSLPGGHADLAGDDAGQLVPVAGQDAGGAEDDGLPGREGRSGPGGKGVRSGLGSPGHVLLPAVGEHAHQVPAVHGGLGLDQGEIALDLLAVDQVEPDDALAGGGGMGRVGFDIHAGLRVDG